MAIKYPWIKHTFPNFFLSHFFSFSLFSFLYFFFFSFSQLPFSFVFFGSLSLSSLFTLSSHSRFPLSLPCHPSPPSVKQTHTHLFLARNQRGTNPGDVSPLTLPLFPLISLSNSLSFVWCEVVRLSWKRRWSRVDPSLVWMLLKVRMCSVLLWLCCWAELEEEDDE